MQLGDAVFLLMPTILDAILIFFIFFFQTIHDAVFELAWSDEPEESKDNKRSENFASHTCIMLIFALFSAI